MQQTTVQTPLGPVPVWGRFDSFDPARPLVFAIRGAFADKDDLTRLPDLVPELDVALVHLPGMHVPFLAELTMDAFCRAYDAAIEALFPQRAILAFGVSMGAAAALGLRHRAVKSALLVDPPLNTKACWPMHDFARRLLRRAPTVQHVAWIENIFGLTATEAPGRDYWNLLDGAPGPVHVILASEPLEPKRAVSHLPSLVSEEARTMLARHPGVRLHPIDGAGHNIQAMQPLALVVVLRRVAAEMAVPA